MNEQLLRDRMQGAVAGIRPASRLDEILAGPSQPAVPPPPPYRRPPSRAVIVLVAAAVVALTGLAVVLILGRAEDPTDRVDLVPASTTTTDPADAARLGDRITVLTSTLPPGMQLLDETPRTGDPDRALFSRFATEPGTWTGDGPYLRIDVLEGEGYADYWATTDRGEAVASVQGAEAYRKIGTAGSIVNDNQSWRTFTWATGPDQVLSIQSKGIDDETVLAIANSVVVEP